MDVGLDHKIKIYALLEGPKSKKERYQGIKRAKVTHGIATKNRSEHTSMAWST